VCNQEPVRFGIGNALCAKKQNQLNEVIKERCRAAEGPAARREEICPGELSESMALRVCQGMCSALRSLCNLRMVVCDTWTLRLKLLHRIRNYMVGTCLTCSVHVESAQGVALLRQRKSALTMFHLLTWFLYNICVWQEWRGRYLIPVKQWCKQFPRCLERVSRAWPKYFVPILYISE
jgi:hypothetical protein